MRSECPACGKSHNRADKATACRAKKARELVRRPFVQVGADISRYGDVGVQVIRRGGRITMLQYITAQTRDNALGMTHNEL